MHIVLLRHAESARNKLLHEGKEDQLHTVSQNSSITTRGKLQALYSGPIIDRLIKSHPNNQIWCSTLDRTGQTLKFAGINMDRVIYKPLLNEWNKDSIESKKNFISRVDMLIRELLSLRDINTVIIAGHSLYFSMLITRIMTKQSNEHLVAEFPNCSISSICIKDNSFAVYNLGDVSHIPKDLQTGVHKPW